MGFVAHVTGTTGSNKLSISIAPVGTLFAMPKVSWKASFTRKIENSCGSPFTADQVTLTLSAEVHPTCVVMVKAEARGAAMARRALVFDV